ncbi:MAG: 2-phosphosulfolactate phosphatase [Bacteroidota bacterium]
MTTDHSVVSHRIHVLGKKEDLDAVRVTGKVAIVLDVLFATSTIVTAMAHGAAEVTPAPDEAAARAHAQGLPPGSFVLAGELYAETLPGFAPPTPLALVDHGVAGKHVVYSTTNGTVALRGAAGAEDVYAAALLNGRAVIDHVLARHPDRTILIVCSGSMGNFNLEDYYGAGYLVDLIAERLGERTDFSDAARAARALYRSGEPYATLRDCRVGRMMAARGLEHEIEFAAQRSTLDVVPRLDGDRLVATR